MLEPKVLRILKILLSTLLLGPGMPLAFPRPLTLKPTQPFDAGTCAEVTALTLPTLTRNPEEAQADVWLARCYLGRAEYDQAAVYAARAVDLDPASSEAHLWLGRSYGLQAERAHSFLLARRVRHEFELAVQLDANNLAARRDLMEFYLDAPWVLGGSQGRAWQQADAIAARDALEGHLARAACWQSLLQPLRAADEYRQALDLRPEQVEPYFEVAEFYERQAQAAQVEGAVKAASRIKPNDPRLDYYRGVARVLEGGPFSEGERFLNNYLARAPVGTDFPSRAAAHEWLGRLYERWGRIKPAVEHYQAAVQLDHRRREAREALSRLRPER
jgi:Tfp pilus assembly protein PilF